MHHLHRSIPRPGDAARGQPIPRPGDIARVTSQQVSVSVSEIVKKLDFATRENVRLKRAVEDNNNFMEQKLQELAISQSESEEGGVASFPGGPGDEARGTDH